MPIYDYVCQQCGSWLEVVHSFKEFPLKICSKCGREALKVVPSPPIIIDRTPRTLGALADKNSSKGSSYYVQEQQRKLMKSNQIVEESCPDWAKPLEHVDVSLASLTPVQQEKYIMTGER